MPHFAAMVAQGINHRRYDRTFSVGTLEPYELSTDIAMLVLWKATWFTSLAGAANLLERVVTVNSTWST